MKRKNNISYQFASVILALLLWILIQGEEILEINKRIEVQLVTPKGYGIKGGQTLYREATLSGSRALLAQLPKKNLKATVKIETHEDLNQKIRLDKGNLFDWDKRIKITIHDAYLQVLLDKKIRKKVQIKENLHGLPHDDYIIEKVLLKPSSIYIQGLQSEIETIESISTYPIDINDIQSSISLQTKLQTDKSKNYTLLTKTVKTRIQVGEKKINKTFKNIPLEIVGASTPYSLHKKHVNIVIQSTSKNLQNTEKNDFQAFLDIQNLSPGNHQRQVQVKIPPKSALIEIAPDIVAIEVYKDSYMR